MTLSNDRLSLMSPMMVIIGYSMPPPALMVPSIAVQAS